jgi:hypothetical protein
VIITNFFREKNCFEKPWDEFLNDHRHQPVVYLKDLDASFWEWGCHFSNSPGFGERKNGAIQILPIMLLSHPICRQSYAPVDIADVQTRFLEIDLGDCDPKESCSCFLTAITHWFTLDQDGKISLAYPPDHKFFRMPEVIPWDELMKDRGVIIRYCDDDSETAK